MDPDYDLDVAQTELSQFSGLVVGLGGYCLYQRLLNVVIQMRYLRLRNRYYTAYDIKLKTNVPRDISRWLDDNLHQPQVVTSVSRKIDGLEIVSIYGEKKLIPWCWIIEMKRRV